MIKGRRMRERGVDTAFTFVSGVPRSRPEPESAGPTLEVKNCTSK